MSNQAWDEETKKYFNDLQNAQTDKERHRIQTEWRTRVSLAVKDAQSKTQSILENEQL